MLSHVNRYGGTSCARHGSKDRRNLILRPQKSRSQLRERGFVRGGFVHNGIKKNTTRIPSGPIVLLSAVSRVFFQDMYAFVLKGNVRETHLICLYVLIQSKFLSNFPPSNGYMPLSFQSLIHQTVGFVGALASPVTSLLSAPFSFGLVAAPLNDCTKSAMMSSMCSVPTEIRMRSYKIVIRW